jgi:hypothetical protein
MLWGPWRSGAPHVLVRRHLGRGVLDVGPYLCSYGYASHAGSSFADAPARHMRPRSLARCTRIQRCFFFDFIAF